MLEANGNIRYLLVDDVRFGREETGFLAAAGAVLLQKSLCTHANVPKRAS